MINKHKIMVAIVSLVVVAVGLYSVKKYDDSLSGKWMFYYGAFDSADVDDAAARSAAETIRWFSPAWSAYYLGHMAVSDAIVLTGDARRRHLAEALEKIESHRYRQDAQSSVGFLKAGLSAMLGDKAKTIKYATEACVIHRPPTKDASCIADDAYVYRLGDATHSRESAIELYEMTKILEIIGGLDPKDLRLGEAVALIHFDINQARELRDAMVRDGDFTGQRREDYCRTMANHKKDAVDAALCGPSR